MTSTSRSARWVSDNYEALDRSAVVFDVDGVSIRVAALDDIIRSKQAADRPKDRAALPLLYALRDEVGRG